jgi:hypothetical protein
MAKTMAAKGMVMPPQIKSSVRTSSLREIEGFLFPLPGARTP